MTTTTVQDQKGKDYLETRSTAPNTREETSSIMVDKTASAVGLLNRLAGARGGMTAAEITELNGANTLAKALDVCIKHRPELADTLKEIRQGYDSAPADKKDAVASDLVLTLHGHLSFIPESALGDMYFTAYAHSYGGTGGVDSPEVRPGSGSPVLYGLQTNTQALDDQNYNAGMGSGLELYKDQTVSLSGAKGQVGEFVFAVTEVETEDPSNYYKIAQGYVTAWGGQGKVKIELVEARSNTVLDPTDPNAATLHYGYLTNGGYILRVTGITDFQHVLVRLNLVPSRIQNS